MLAVGKSAVLQNLEVESEDEVSFLNFNFIFIIFNKIIIYINLTIIYDKKYQPTDILGYKVSIKRGNLRVAFHFLGIFENIFTAIIFKLISFICMIGWLIDWLKDESGSKGAGKGMFSIFKGLVGSKALTKEDLEPVISKLRDNLIDKVRTSFHIV